mmetsp:Transcript_101953/g.233501  ORF Transcript_101953/g.233501 Transcript_101953/m.233501 type:complete len:194 (+) Transcript_101953:66-647(+)
MAVLSNICFCLQKEEEDPQASKQDIAAAKIQAVMRGQHTRASMQHQKEDKAATLIESHFRGFQVRTDQAKSLDHYDPTEFYQKLEAGMKIDKYGRNRALSNVNMQLVDGRSNLRVRRKTYHLDGLSEANEVKQDNVGGVNLTIPDQHRALLLKFPNRDLLLLCERPEEQLELFKGFNFLITQKPGSSNGIRAN